MLFTTDCCDTTDYDKYFHGQFLKMQELTSRSVWPARAVTNILVRVPTVTADDAVPWFAMFLSFSFLHLSPLSFNPNYKPGRCNNGGQFFWRYCTRWFWILRPCLCNCLLHDSWKFLGRFSLHPKIFHLHHLNFVRPSICLVYVFFKGSENSATVVNNDFRRNHSFKILKYPRVTMPQIGSIPKISATGELNYSFALFAISYFVVVNWTLLQVRSPSFRILHTPCFPKLSKVMYQNHVIKTWYVLCVLS